MSFVISCLGDVVEFIRGVTFDKSQQHANPRTSSVAVLRAGNIQSQLNTATDLIYVPANVVSDAQMLRKGDIAICLSSGSPQIVGKTALLESDWVGTVGGFCGIIRPKAVDPAFLSLWMRGPMFLAWRDEQARGANIQNLRFSELGELAIRLPEASEQSRIAAYLQAQLAEVESARQAVQVQRHDADVLGAAIYREAFQGLVPIAVPPALGTGPPGWKWHKITDLALLESGHTPSRSRPDWWGGDVSWISLTEIRAFDGRWVEGTQLRTNAAGIANSAARILPRGTVCYSRTASVGFVTIMAQPMATSQDFANWVCGDDLDPEYLMHTLIRSRKELRALATGATHKTIYMPTLESFHVCAPDPDTQRRIVRALRERLTEATVLRAALDAQQAELATLPQRLLTQAFEN